MKPAVLVTRPEAASADFEQRLADRFGPELRIVTSPVMRIRFRAQPLDLTGVSALIFTSKHGVEGFAMQSPRRDLQCWAVGAATAQAARAKGFSTRESGGDSDAILADLVAQRATGAILHVRGEHVSGDLVARLSSQGIPARDVVVYDQPKERLSEQAVDLLAGEGPIIVPLFSARSAQLLSAQGPYRAALWGVALSANVAKAAEGLDCAQMTVAREHNSRAMVEAIAGLLEP